MKIKQLMTAIIFAITPVLSLANTPSDMDLELLEYGVVDSSFKYKDLELATQYFKAIHNRYLVSLPLYIDRYVEWTSSMVTPFEQTYSYKDYRIDENVKLTFEQSEILDLCEEIFTDLYLSRNNVNIHLRYYNSNDKLISTVNLNRRTCNQ